MAINFPSNPSDGQVWVDAGTGIEWVYNSTDNSWTVDATGPVSPFQFRGGYDFTTNNTIGSIETGDLFIHEGSDGTVGSGYTGLSGQITAGTLVLWDGVEFIKLSSSVPNYPDTSNPDYQNGTLDDRYLSLAANASTQLVESPDKTTFTGHVETPRVLSNQLRSLDETNRISLGTGGSTGMNLTTTDVAQGTNGSRSLQVNWSTDADLGVGITNVQSVLNAVGTSTKDVVHFATTTTTNQNTSGDLIGFKSNIGGANNTGTGGVYNFFAEGNAPSYYEGLIEGAGGVRVTGGTVGAVGHGMTYTENSDGSNQRLRLVNNGTTAVQLSETIVSANLPITIKPDDAGLALSFNSPSTTVDVPDGASYMNFTADHTGTTFEGDFSFAQVGLPGATADATVSCSNIAGFKVLNSFGRFNAPNDGNTTSGFRSNLGKRSNKNIFNFYAEGDAPNYYEGLVECKSGVLTEEIDSDADILLKAPNGKVTLESSDGYRFEGTIASAKGFEMVATVTGPFAADQNFQYGFFYPRVRNYDGDDTNRLTSLNCCTTSLYTGAVNSSTPYIKQKIGFNALSGIGTNTWDDATEQLNIGFRSQLPNISQGSNFNFYADGGAKNYMAAELISSATPSFVRKDPATGQGNRAVQISGDSSSPISVNMFGTGGGATCMELNRLGNSSAGPYITFHEDGGATAAGSISCDNGAVSFNDTSDYRLKENVASLSTASESIKALRPVSFQYTSNPNYTHLGFIAHELQAVVPQAVSGNKDETEEVGTVVDYDGTILETSVPEPDSLTYTQKIVDETQPALDGEEPRMVEVTRTKTWASTGTQPVYQNVDPRKLIPLLTKSLQEALERIEALEAAATSGY